MNEQNKLHADGYFVFETKGGIIGRTGIEPTPIVREAGEDGA